MPAKTYREAIDQAWDLLRAIGKQGAADLEFLGKTCRIDFERRQVTSDGGERLAGEYHEVLILHYAAREKAVSVSEPFEWIGFRELGSGPFYYPKFRQRSVGILNQRFSGCPEAAWEKARGLGREKLPIGDFGFRVRVFPKIAVAVLYWRGDEEVVAQFDLLFNREVERIFSTEDVVVLAQATVGALL